MGTSDSEKYADSVHIGDSITTNVVNEPKAIIEAYEKGKARKTPARIPIFFRSFAQSIDFGVFKKSETWKAFAIAGIMFVAISFGALSMFDSMDDIFQSDADPEPIPNIVFESLNRTGVESELVNETGWFNLDDLRGSVIIFDMMAHDCSNCHAVQ